MTGALHVAIDSVSVTGGGGMINITNVAPGLADINDAPTLTANTALVLDIATSMTLEGQAISNVSAPGSPPPEFTVINIMGTGTALSMGGNAQLSALVNVPNGDAVVGGSNGAFYGSIMAQNVTTNGGVAIIMVLLAVLVLSALTAAIVFTTRAETLSAYNYRIVSQAEYTAWAGIQRAVNFLNGPSYTAVTPSNAPTTYDVNVYSIKPTDLHYSNDSGVECIADCATLSAPVTLSTSGGSNYPIASVITNFANALNNQTLTAAAGHTGNFTVTAQLMDYHTVNNDFYPAVNVRAFEVWKVTSTGSWNSNIGAGAANPTVVVNGVIAPVYLPYFANAMFGICNVTMNGTSCTDSYNSSSGLYDGTSP